jgi:hypothetical protein
VTADRTPEEILEIRRKLIEVEFHAKSDAKFLERLREHPLELLREEGFDDSTTSEILDQLAGDSALEFGKCDPFTCLVTGCSFFTAELADLLPPEN